VFVGVGGRSDAGAADDADWGKDWAERGGLLAELSTPVRKEAVYVPPPLLMLFSGSIHALRRARR